MGVTHYLLGDFQAARSSCERNAQEYDLAQYCLAITYDKLGRHPDAEAMLAKSRASDGETGAVWSVMAYAQWGAPARALDWLETAMRLRDPVLKQLKNPLLDPLHEEPRFQAIEREWKFPE